MSLHQIVSKSKVSSAEIQAAQEQFYRRARLEYIRMHCSEWIRIATSVKGGAREDLITFTDASGNAIKRVLCSSGLYMGFTTLFERVVVVIASRVPYAKLLEFELISDTNALEALRVLRALHERPLVWCGVFPVVTWQVIVEAKELLSDFPITVLRVYNHLHDSITLGV
jgi:hypothetical protein